MKAKKLISKNMIILIIVLTIIFIGVLITWVQKVNDVAIIDSTFDEIDQIGVQYQGMLNSSLKNAREDLTLLAKTISRYEINNDNILEFFESQSQIHGFTNLYYIDSDGNGISPTDERQNFSDSLFYQTSIDGEFYISEPHISSETQDIVFDMSMPIEIEGSISAVLFCEVSVADFFTVIADNKDYEGDIFFVNSNLEMIFSTSGNHIGSSTIPPEDVAEMGDDNVLAAQVDIINKQSGGFYYDYFGIPKVMVYFPVELTDVALAMNVHVESISYDILQSSKYFEIVGIVIYWTVIVLVAYILYSQSRATKKMLKVAYYDQLTGLANMAKLKTDMTSILEDNTKKSYSIVVIDIENFKAINEMFGYEVGDRVLKTVKSFADGFKEPSLITARIGSDKFAMFANSDFLDNLSSFPEKVDKHFNIHVPELTDYAGSFKIGRYKIEIGETDFDDIMAKVNLAHVKAKSLKGEFFYDYDETLKRQVVIEADINNKMNSALTNKEFIVYLQPKFSTSDNNLVGAEALVRWIESDGNMIYPNDFIPLFERNGFVVELDKYVLENVCATISRWIGEGLGPLTISVNCSRQNLGNPFFVNGVVAIADKYQVPHEYIEIELTESTTILNESTIEQLFIDLHKNGFKISIDDFGAGYSSLGMLKNLHVDTLKMDRSFFVGGKNARRDDMLIDSIVKMSHNLGMYVVAEGIETPEQVELLRSMNCDAIQGYVHAKPMPTYEFEALYCDAIKKNNLSKSDNTSIIKNINDVRLVNSFAPCGLLATELDEFFTIVEANDYYFNMVDITREEARDIYNNRGINIMNAESQLEISEYIANHMKNTPDEMMEFTGKFTLRSGELHIYRLRGKAAVNESGQTRLYFSVIDTTDYFRADSELQSERDFIARIASLTSSAFYDYDLETKAIRFSKNFAETYNIPEVIEDFNNSDIGKRMFPVFIEALSGMDGNSKRLDGEFYIPLPCGEPIWNIFSCESFYDSSKKKYRAIGKISKTHIHKLEMDILRIKSEADPLTSVYSKQATERYIRSYLRVAIPDNDKGAFFVVKIDSLSDINEKFGREFGDECLKDIGNILRNTFRSTDIIGRADGSKFYVFINSYKELSFIEEKATELCKSLSKSYEKDGTTIPITASIGISLYPEHGDNFDNVYNKADAALQKVQGSEKTAFTIHE